MGEISMPLRIALLVTLAFGVLWMVVLRPKPADETPAAAAATPAATAAPAPATPAAGQPAPAPKARPAAKRAASTAPTGAPPHVLRALERGRTLVLLVWDGRSSDDRAVRDAVRAVDRRGGRVAVHTARLQDLDRYAGLLRDAPVTASPTVLVVGADRRAEAITGFTVTAEIEAAVREARRRGR